MVVKRARIGQIIIFGLIVLSFCVDIGTLNKTLGSGSELVAQTVGETPSSTNFIIPLPSSRSLSTTELAGKKLFVQRCSICHLPGLPTYKTYAPILDGKITAAMGEGKARDYILHGSQKMPGFQYTLNQADTDAIIAYLRVLVYDSTTQKYTYSSTKNY